MRTSIMNDVSTFKSESETASLFEKYLYCVLKKEIGIELAFNKDIKVGLINHKFEGLKNKTIEQVLLDVIVNNLIIECQHFSNLTNQDAIDKATVQVEA